jgi:hypothetical protein
VRDLGYLSVDARPALLHFRVRRVHREHHRPAATPPNRHPFRASLCRHGRRSPVCVTACSYRAAFLGFGGARGDEAGAGVDREQGRGPGEVGGIGAPLRVLHLSNVDGVREVGTGFGAAAVFRREIRRRCIGRGAARPPPCFSFSARVSTSILLSHKTGRERESDKLRDDKCAIMATASSCSSSSSSKHAWVTPNFAVAAVRMTRVLNASMAHLKKHPQTPFVTTNTSR